MEDTVSPRNVSGIVSVSGFVLLFGTLIAGGIILAISYVISGLFRFRPSRDLRKNEQSSGTEESQEIFVPQQGGKKLKNKKRREPQPKCSHTWLMGSLRGHTNNVLDLNFSTNGKFVATCAEVMICLDVNRSYESSDKDLQTLENDKLDDVACHRNKLHWIFSLVTIPADNKEDIRHQQLSAHHRPPTEENLRHRFNCSNLAMSKLLARYVLTPKQRSLIGYPIPWAWRADMGTVNYIPYPTGRNPANTTELVMDNCYGTYNHVPETSFATSYKRIKCIRCFKIFFLTRSNNNIFEEEECVYHWGKYIEKMINGRPSKVWSCCQGEATSPGCDRARMHVWSGLMPGANHLVNCMRSTKPEVQPPNGFYGVYGLDTEMCFTWNGLEIVQIALVDMNGIAVYNTYVKPEGEVIDYNTRFSGITASDLEGVKKTLKDVHREIASFIHEDTILIGHGLENDLRVLRLLHNHCIDTSIVFPHHYGFPYRNSLKYLAKRLLNRDIHEKKHDPVEDARTAVDLILLKLHSDYFEELASKRS